MFNKVLVAEDIEKELGEVIPQALYLNLFITFKLYL